MAERRSDTREQIRKVALELFAEQGYEKTSLREIAERLGVTKAALYYHFKTKEDIIASLFGDVQERVEEIIAWAETQPRTLETRKEIVRRYADVIAGPGRDLSRFMFENGPAVRHLKAGDETRQRLMRLMALVSVDNARPADQLRARLSLFSMQMSLFALRDTGIGEEERQAAALEVALDLVTAADSAPAAQSTAM